MMKALGSLLSWLIATAITLAVLVAAFRFFGTPGLIIAIALGASWAIRDARRILQVWARLEDQRREARYELQWFDEFVESRLHFPTMLLRWHASEDVDMSLYNVRRNGDGTWQRQITSRSHEVWVKQMYPVERWWEKQQEEREWEELYSAQVEVAYQRFIHAQDVPIAVYGTGIEEKTLAEFWGAEEEKHAESRKAAGKWDEKWVEYRSRFTAEEFEAKHVLKRTGGSPSPLKTATS